MYCPRWRRTKPREAVGSARFQVGLLAEASREAERNRQDLTAAAIII